MRVTSSHIYSLAFMLIAALPLSALERPLIIQDAARLNGDPHKFTGYVRINNPSGTRGIGSGSVVGPGAILTAAHVVFDSTSMQWVNGVRMQPRHHSTFEGLLYNNTAFLFPTIIREASYRDRVVRDRDDGIGEGRSSRDTFNLDVATAFRIFRFDPRAMVPGNLASEVSVDGDNFESWMRKPFAKMVLGYPSNAEFIPANEQGFMHEVAADDYLFFWDGFYETTETHRDSGGFWNALYSTWDFQVFSGNSGGPVFVRDPDLNVWMNSGIVVGGSSQSSLIRAIDGTAWAMIAAAQAGSGEQRLQRITGKTARPSANGRSIELTWQDSSAQATAVRVLRQHGIAWQQIASLPPSARSFTDTEVLPGSLYAYALQPVDALGNLAPRSETLRVATPGHNAQIATPVGAPLLTWRTEGDVAFIPDQGAVRPGRVPSMGHSRMVTRVTGPGELSFRWSVSSEHNEDLPQTGSSIPTGDQLLYDAFLFSVNGEVRRWISGSVDNDTVQISLPSGQHELIWEYRKDPYSDELMDSGFLHQVSWLETGGQVITGAYAMGEGQFRAHWWGEFANIGAGWNDHAEFGPVYHVARQNGFWSYATAGDMGWFFTSPQLFPYIWLPDRGWFYYVRGSAVQGERWLGRDLIGNAWLRLDAL